MQIDVTASTLEDYPEKVCYSEPCVPLYPTNGGPIIASPPEADAGKDRYIMVDVGGQTVVINVTAPAGKFDAFSPKAQKVLDTVERKKASSRYHAQRPEVRGLAQEQRPRGER